MIAAYVYYEGTILDAKCFDETTAAHHFANKYWDCTKAKWSTYETSKRAE